MIGAAFATKGEAEAFASYTATAMPKEKPMTFCSDAATMQDYAKQVSQAK
jgi:hypothetical protein